MVFSNYDPKIMFKNFPDFFKSESWLEYESERDGYKSKIHMDFTAFSDYIYEKIKKEDFSQLKEIFQIIETCMKHENPMIGEAAATCFLENLINHASGDAGRRSYIDPNVFIPLLGSESREYCKAWDEFTKVKTSGLWENSLIVKK